MADIAQYEAPYNEAAEHEKLNKALQCNAKIETALASQPNVYERYVEILKAFYNNTTGYEETCDAITRLFNEAGKPGLLKEIQDFFDFCKEVWWERMLYCLDRS